MLYPYIRYIYLDTHRHRHSLQTTSSAVVMQSSINVLRYVKYFTAALLLDTGAADLLTYSFHTVLSMCTMSEKFKADIVLYSL